MKIVKQFIASLLLLFVGSSTVFGQNKELAPGMYAQFNTTKGEILIQLEPEKTPLTVANFVGLVEGNFRPFDTLSFDKPFYDGLKFHRVIKDFMIQGGDPQGTGMGGPGYKFFDEPRQDLSHSGPGILSMANSGPATNGSQFFITHKETPWLNGKHTVFGHVISGMDVVNAIVQDDVMEQVRIIRIGDQYQSWNATEVFKVTYRKMEEAFVVMQAEKARLDAIEKERTDKIAKMTEEEYKVYLLAEVRKTYPKAQQTASGLVYVIEKKGDANKKPKKGDEVSTHYTGTLMNGTKFDSSLDRNQPLNFKHNVGQMIPGYDEAVAMLGKGGKGRFIIPYTKAYGAAGRPPVIPAYSDLVFEIELMDITPGSASVAPATPAPAPKTKTKKG
jgi:peptidyl-prolyl cis-trans isomerase A (cyclophilin A)|uniref:peptidylprolyl isomerase n=1 Tax=Fluviicola sp. TaxID=1917219 RepID=UPI0040496515